MAKSDVRRVVSAAPTGTVPFLSRSEARVSCLCARIGWSERASCHERIMNGAVGRALIRLVHENGLEGLHFQPTRVAPGQEKGTYTMCIT